MFYAVVKAVATVFMRIFFPYKVHGRKNFKPKTGRVLVCNHLSAWDIPLLAVAMPFSASFMGKKELFRNRILGYIFQKWMYGIPVDRQNPRPGMIKEVVKRLKAGKNIMLFPEGKRNTENGAELMMATLKEGAALFAILASVPIQPMAIDARSRLFRRNNLMVGELVYVGGAGVRADKETLQKTSELLRERMEGLQAALRDSNSKKREKKKGSRKGVSA
jgi:1-acyl-sn-glycerol-3-phosphate acyltransferase